MANKETPKKAEDGNTVKVSYRGTLDNGEVFDSCEDKNPLEFKIGANQVIPDFEKAIIGMKIGEKKTIHIKASDAYGNYDEKLIKKIPRSVIPEKMEVKKGMIVVLKTQQGMNLNSIVKEVTKDELTIDLNHPLAGKALNFELKLVEIV
jgi:peptidylprolyl isomerase